MGIVVSLCEKNVAAPFWNLKIIICLDQCLLNLKSLIKE